MKKLTALFAIFAFLVATPTSEASTWSQFFSNVKSIQTGTITTSGGTGTATISSVNTAKAVVTFNGFASPIQTQMGRDSAYVVLTNATTVTANQGAGTASAATVAFTVVEYN